MMQSSKKLLFRFLHHKAFFKMSRPAKTTFSTSLGHLVSKAPRLKKELFSSSTPASPLSKDLGAKPTPCEGILRDYPVTRPVPTNTV
jgi:hypothetical protein